MIDSQNGNYTRQVMGITIKQFVCYNDLALEVDIQVRFIANDIGVISKTQKALHGFNASLRE